MTLGPGASLLSPGPGASDDGSTGGSPPPPDDAGADGSTVMLGSDDAVQGVLGLAVTQPQRAETEPRRGTAPAMPHALMTQGAAPAWMVWKPAHWHS